jgi:membrane-associated phospholipid phosphatase
MKLSLKQKTIISVALFVVVFAGLLVAASFTDLEVSHILTQEALPDGEYLASDFFGVFFEIMGSAAIYIVIGICAIIMFWFFTKCFDKKPWNKILALVFFAAGVVAFWFVFSDMYKYSIEHILKDAYLTGGNEMLRYELIHELEDNGAFIAVEILLALVVNTLGVVAMKNVKPETLKKLVKFVLAFVVMAVVSNVLVMILKGPVGRMRYRAMNSTIGQGMGGFANYTPWYVMTDNNELFNSKEIFGYSDGFKSFPSGHTCAAGMMYAFIMLADTLELKKTWQKALVWAGTIVATGLVAISRIVVGAHFFSDVLMGGTLAFVSMIIAREIFIFKGAHFKAVFSKCAPAPAEPEVDEVEEVSPAETPETAQDAE